MIISKGISDADPPSSVTTQLMHTCESILGNIRDINSIYGKLSMLSLNIARRRETISLTTSKIEDGYDRNTAIISFIAWRQVKANQGSFDTFLLYSFHCCLGRDGTAESYTRACRLPESRIREVWQSCTCNEARSGNIGLDKEEFRTATNCSCLWTAGSGDKDWMLLIK
jgi:hypothetical protein